MQERPHVAYGPRMEAVASVHCLINRRESIQKSLNLRVPHGLAHDSHRHKSELVRHAGNGIPTAPGSPATRSGAGGPFRRRLCPKLKIAAPGFTGAAMSRLSSGGVI